VIEGSIRIRYPWPPCERCGAERTGPLEWDEILKMARAAFCWSCDSRACERCCSGGEPHGRVEYAAKEVPPG
jgi:hypothetical protein